MTLIKLNQDEVPSWNISINLALLDFQRILINTVYLHTGGEQGHDAGLTMPNH